MGTDANSPGIVPFPIPEGQEATSRRPVPHLSGYVYSGVSGDHVKVSRGP